MVMAEGMGDRGITTRRQRRGFTDQPVTDVFLGDTGKAGDAKPSERRRLNPRTTLLTNS